MKSKVLSDSFPVFRLRQSVSDLFYGLKSGLAEAEKGKSFNEKERRFFLFLFMTSCWGGIRIPA